MKNQPEPPILLVAMPFTLIRWPSLSLSLLKRILIKNNMACRVIYGNLLYAEQVGLDAFLFAENGWAQVFLGEWLFHRRLFPETPLSAKTFLLDYLGGKGLSPEKQGRTIQILETLKQRSEDFLLDLVQTILARRPRIVGCSLNVVQLFSSLALFQELKKQDPHILTLAGGPACEGTPGMALHRHFTEIDFLFSGDADESIRPVCTALLNEGRELEPDTAPPGLITPAHRRKSYPSPAPRATFDQLDENPLPDYDDFFSTLEHSKTVKERLHPALPFEASRGCWWGERTLCNFCGDCGVYPRYRTRSGKRVLEDLTRLNKRYGVSRFVALDNVVNPDFFQSFFPKLEKQTVEWALFFEIRPSLIKKEIETMRRAGVTYVQAGIESLHTGALKAMNKGVQSWQNIQCLKWCRQYGISISWFFITRFPGENDDWNREQAELIALLTHLHPPRSVGIIRPDRHSPYFARAESEGMDIQPKPRYLRFFKGMEGAARKFVFHLHDRRVADLLSDPLEHLVRPGRKALQRAVASWQRAAVAENPPVLEMLRENDQGWVSDTRPQAVEKVHILSRTAVQVLNLADSAPREEKLYTMGMEKGLKPEEIETHLRHLTDKGLILHRDGRILSLVLEPPCSNLPEEKDLPVGWIEGEERIRTTSAIGCEAFWELV